MRRLGLGIACLTLLLLAARGPLHRVTHGLPISNDDAIPLLMARQVLRGELATILWNQPYNGTLDAYLLAPASWFWSPHGVFRAYEALCGILLVVAAGVLARRTFGEGAGWAGAALAAVGTPYMALMAATGPTPNFLVPLLVAVPAAWGLGRLARHEPATAEASRPASLLGLGLLCGLAVWDSMLALPALAGTTIGLLVAGLRPRVTEWGALAVGTLVGLVPLFVAARVGASAASPVTALRPRWLWAQGARDLARAAAGLFGLQVPLVVDGPERAILPAVAAAALGLALATLVILGARSRRALPLVLWSLALMAAFAASRRTGGDEIRYLFGLALPVLALAGGGLAAVTERSRLLAAAALLALVVPWSLGQARVREAWADPTHAARVWQVPDIEPALASLARGRVTSAYASLQFAARLAVHGGPDLFVSQAWNERIPGDPLRFRDEVDLDPRAAWVLSPHLSRGLPRAAGFRELLHDLGGAWHEDVAGDLHVFRAFRPPFDERKPVPAAEIAVATVSGERLPVAVTDRDPATVWSAPLGLAPGSGIVVALETPRRVSALVLRVPLDPTPLAVPWVCEVDGAVVAHGPKRHTLQWVSGVPRAGRQAVLTVVLGDVAARTIRLLFQDTGPRLELSEVFLYGPDEAAVPPSGEAAAEQALAAARAGEWSTAVARYRDAVRAEPHRASFHAALVRAEWRAGRRQWLDVESLDDGGPALVERRP
jgi:hypothetical protein